MEEPLFILQPRKNCIELAKLLLSHGAKVNIKDDHGETALNKASRYNNDEIVRLIISYGAKK
ncbi:hypothetical protein TVAG_206540 [Trichomonas vaginalis G3]|uniref:Uncharacterized protein n=1 Tax=Trichomonas vaginalis (strain ATCC PRA-98 / G3) TaxID=412133 RepID=A2E1N9_TRIV3|nr:Ankyrin repeat family [Trichomonas vaginalis G3]EAY13486.1 hypothetical protein TVAG_206540 [Trichomonas vaginalis G3]KAI5518056.1 Ankyrin repeat family [Trichomonas vaginalis G3]|eukprot:XP_001325709.1 hypothetical protein [Trichomonas vaginalis G3]